MTVLCLRRLQMWRAVLFQPGNHTKPARLNTFGFV